MQDKYHSYSRLWLDINSVILRGGASWRHALLENEYIFISVTLCSADEQKQHPNYAFCFRFILSQSARLISFSCLLFC